MADEDLQIELIGQMEALNIRTRNDNVAVLSTVTRVEDALKANSELLKELQKKQAEMIDVIARAQQGQERLAKFLEDISKSLSEQP